MSSYNMRSLPTSSCTSDAPAAATRTGERISLAGPSGPSRNALAMLKMLWCQARCSHTPQQKETPEPYSAESSSWYDGSTILHCLVCPPNLVCRPDSASQVRGLAVRTRRLTLGKPTLRSHSSTDLHGSVVVNEKGDCCGCFCPEKIHRVHPWTPPSRMTPARPAEPSCLVAPWVT